MSAKAKQEKLNLGLTLEHYRYDARHYPAQGHARWIDYNYVQGMDFAWRCPAWQHEGFDAYGAAGKCNVVYQLLKGELDYAAPSVREVAYKCFLCGSCDVAGKRNVDFEMQLMLESLRVRLVEQGYGPMPAHEARTRRIEDSGNCYGLKQSQRRDWLTDDIKPAAKADVLYYVGCPTSFHDTAVAQATARILTAAGTPFMLLENEPCCGDFIFITGQLEKARKIAADNIKLIKQSGAKTVVCSDATVYKTIKVDYPKMLGFATADLGFEVRHITELADAWVQEGKLKLDQPVNMKVTYHDPDGLGRQSENWLHWEGERGKWGVFEPERILRRAVHGVYEAPRRLLEAIPGLELTEMVRRRENAFNCGSGGGVGEAFPELAKWTAAERVREAAATGAEAVVTADAGCKEAMRGVAGSGLDVYDITELIVRAMGQ